MAHSLFKIPSFHGIDQSCGIFSSNAGTSPEAVNILCRSGVLMTAPGMTAVAPTPVPCVRLFQGFFRDDGGKDVSFILAAGEGNIYVLRGNEWTLLGSGFASDDWCAVNYRHENDDWLILANGRDDLHYWDGKSETLGVISVSCAGNRITPSHLTLLYERLWGAVASEYPDRIHWSDSFAPDNWELNYDAPEDGGGFMDIATFDGSRIRAVAAAFDDVLIFKDRSMHRLSGTYPGDFSLTQVYGSEGTLAARTIVHTADRLYFLGSDGLCVYNGMSVSSLTHGGDRRMKEVFARINQEAIDCACAALHENILCLAVPLDGAAVNSHVIEYDLTDGSWAILECGGITDWLILRSGQSEELFCLTGSALCRFGEGDSFAGKAIHAKWISPVLTLGSRTLRKRTGRLYAAVHAPQGARIVLSTESETMRAEKSILLPEGHSIVRLRLRVRGRNIRFGIESGDDRPFSLPDGIEIEMEADSDR